MEAVSERVTDHDALGFYKSPYDMENYIDDIERDLIVEALRACDNSKSEAAKFLGIKRTTLISKYKRLNIEQTRRISSIDRIIIEKARLEAKLRFLNYFLKDDYK